ncbi:MAG: putative bifunctional diguanylate cyclase/phosphodiesterase [Piscinibacter sp.]|uniref:putative bifunctional diguanylate cyclase/phosphodiesterase n=1 Tax=Piscinibacter sp. TaxID=1903157 RepID=UPI003D0B8DCA
MNEAPVRAHRSRLARRLFLLFVLVAIVPLVLTDWIASLATSEVATRLTQDHRVQTTRHTSRQVFDRLLAGKSLLLAQAEARAQELPPGLGRVFSQVVRVEGADVASWPPHRGEDLIRAWQAAAAGRFEVPADRNAVEVQLRVDYSLPGQPRVMLGAHRRGSLAWLAVLEADYLWGPLADAGLDTAWWVHDGQDRLVLHQAGEDYTLLDERSSAGDDLIETTTELFLGGELLASDWRFTQRAPRKPVLWFGAPLVLWLGLVAAAALIVIAMLSHWRIRMALEPLAELTRVTRRLAKGAAGARVEIRRDDEIGELAEAFNEMAARIETQFDALEGLAAIDRDILAGAPFERVTGHALQRIAMHYPQACAMVAWRDGERGMRQAWLAPAADTTRLVLNDRFEPGEGGFERFATIGEDIQRVATEPGEPPCGALAPCLRNAGIDRAAVAVLLPLRHEGRTVAMLGLGVGAPLPDEALQPAREVRDRLTVALAARMREEQLVHRAAHDSLTGLVNRYGLQTRLEALLGRAAQGARLAVLSIDLDHFKDVNDTLGHEAGDELLSAASHRLRSCVPAGAVVARPGGDEFIVLLPEADAATAASVADVALAALGRPFALRGGENRLGASAGIAMCPDHGTQREELMRCADIALFAAKGAGRGQHVLFTSELDRASRERVQMQLELRQALDRDEFVVHYQPRVQPGDGRILAAEALIRWQHPQRGLLYPGAFIEVAEAAGLIDEMGRWVLDAACAQAAVWRREGLSLQRISVNVSPRQLASGELPALVADVLERHRLPGSALELEVTESLLMNDPGDARAQLAALRQRGVTVALDDFGTGYSSMALLRQLPIDVMKVDRSFVVGLGTDDGAMAVTRAIVTLARSLRLHLVAEGVETEAQAEVLRSLGCDQLQGYLFSRPVPAAGFARLAGLARGVPGSRLTVVPARLG